MIRLKEFLQKIYKYTQLIKEEAVTHQAIVATIKSPDFTKESHDKLLSEHKDNPKVIRDVLQLSPHSTYEDAVKYDKKGGVASLLGNKSLSDDTANKVKKHIMSGYDKLRLHKHITKILGLNSDSDVLTIPSSVSSKFTAADHNKLAGMKANGFAFENVNHANDHLDAIYKKIKSANSEVDYCKKSDPDGLDYARDDLRNHIKHYADMIGNHINQHILEGGNTMNLISKSEAEKTLGRLTKGGNTSLGDIANYKPDTDKVDKAHHEYSIKKKADDLKQAIDMENKYPSGS